MTPKTLCEQHERTLANAKILFTDVDGTLVAPGGVLLADASGRPSVRTAAAVVELNRAGLPVVITTGRNRMQCTEIARLLGWQVFIAELGCVVQFDRYGEPSYLTGEWPDDALREDETPWEAIVRVGALDALAEAFPGRIENHDPWHVDRIATHVLRGNVDLAAAQAVLDALPLPIDIIDNGIIRPPRHTLVAVEEVHAYHLVPRGTSKTHAISFVLERLGLEREQAISVGDSATDVEMADATALLVLVANALADEAALTAARSRPNVAVTEHERGEGWAELAEAWLAARSRRTG
ncbi:Cof-type HAD-IIB family hydrolase [Coriobacteriia bacterium Es71-Z0120]|uniref:HAD-IIB family hydrolase n=1 Tax=Parvivirga hydrogeniphila TaxID=2939460 RepID=UPI002260F0E4|nr:HAD family hydrolase [Parvivirga hydrogeniphila]MCL4078244.1 Cof-type HAD-IIB family hydrolase [Parvivirga hydrogeniphila]